MATESNITHRVASLPLYRLPAEASFAMTLELTDYDPAGKYIELTAQSRYGRTASQVWRTATTDDTPAISISGATVTIEIARARASVDEETLDFSDLGRNVAFAVVFRDSSSDPADFVLQGDLDFLPDRGDFDPGTAASTSVALTIATGSTVSVEVKGVIEGEAGAVTSVVGETGAVTASQIKTAYESLADTNAYTDAEKSKLDDLGGLAGGTTGQIGTKASGDDYDLAWSDDLTVPGLLTADHIHGNLAGTLYIHVKNTSGGALDKGTPVYVTGHVGSSDRVEVAAADSSDPAKMPAIALLAQDLGINGEGDGVIVGEIRTYDTDSPGWALNDEIFVGTSGLTTTRPTTGSVQPVATVGRIQASTGVLVINCQGQRTPDESFADATHSHTLSDITDAGTAAANDTGDFEASGAVSTHAAITSGVHGISTFGASLVDDTDAATARTTLGLGTAATSAAGDFATAAQGALADSAVQPGDVVDDLTTGGSAVPGSAAQLVVLKGLIDNINTLLASDETTLDTLQEVVDFIELNRADLDALGISSIAGLQTALDGKAESSHNHTLSDVTDAGTSASLDVPAAGDAAVGEVVKGDDSRLTNARTPTSHTHTMSDITDAGGLATEDDIEGTAVKSTGETGGSKFLREDGDGTCSWQTIAGGGDMLASTYDPGSVSEQVVGLTATQTLTNKTLTTPTITLKQGTAPAPTAEGDIQWDTDDNQIKVGDGAATKVFSDDSQLATAAQGALADSAQQPPAEGAFVDGDKTKLDGIEVGADVTDTANVTAAGALMDSEVTNLAQVKAFDSSDYMPIAEPYYLQAALSVNGAAISAGTFKGFARVPKSGNITDVTIDCDPNNEPSAAAVQVDCNTVDRSTGAATSVLSAVASIATSGNTGSGTVNGTQAVSAGDLLSFDIDQGSDGKDLIVTVEITPT